MQLISGWWLSCQTHSLENQTPSPHHFNGCTVFLQPNQETPSYRYCKTREWKENNAFATLNCVWAFGHVRRVGMGLIERVKCGALGCVDPGCIWSFVREEVDGCQFEMFFNHEMLQHLSSLRKRDAVNLWGLIWIKSDVDTVTQPHTHTLNTDKCSRVCRNPSTLYAKLAESIVVTNVH